jgi:hypothetical protein
MAVMFNQALELTAAALSVYGCTARFAAYGFQRCPIPRRLQLSFPFCKSDDPQTWVNYTIR